MSTLIFSLSVLVLLFGLAYWRRGMTSLATGLIVLTLIAGFVQAVGPTVVLAFLSLGALLLAIPLLRRRLIGRPIFAAFSKMLPHLSDTEREAIAAGTVWWDSELFSGRPDWRLLLGRPPPSLTAEEQAFLDGPVNELCRLSDAWNINHNWNALPDRLIEYVRRNGFLGMIIPKRYGGLELSAYAQSQVLVKLSNSGGGVTYLVAVPNSLGPGELLLKYGTEEQKDHYLPRLARGDEIPCFALTAPTAGSDATSIPDVGIVCRGRWQGREVLGMRLSFDKRYITLAPIATLVGLAFRLKDPEHLLGEVDDYGITCALIPRETEGLDIGRRHQPVGDAFINGPVRGSDVFVPLDAIIGGPAMAGKGWTMLVNCLSVGRCITLPTGAVSVGKRMLKGSSAYAALRKQFGQSLSRFEGIQQPLARIAGFAYIIDAARSLTIQSLDHGEKPSVPSAIIKYHCTEMARQCALDAMDIHGGKAVMKGPGNYIANAFESIPVAITVEGANILTRNLMIFGQGAIRSHPYALREIELAQRVEDRTALAEFDRILFAHIGSTLSNAVRAFVMGLTGARFIRSPGHASLRGHYQRIERLSAAFALVADVSMLSLGARLKIRESLSARLGDMLSHLYLASMVLKHHENAGCPAAERPVVEWAMAHLAQAYQTAFLELMRNFPRRGPAALMRFVVFPLGARLRGPADATVLALAKEVVANTSLRERLIEGLYLEDGPNNPLSYVDSVFRQSLALEPLFGKLRQAVREGRLPKLQGTALIKAARRLNLLDKHEARALFDFDARLMEVINVDDFDANELMRVPYDASEDVYPPPSLREAV